MDTLTYSMALTIPLAESRAWNGVLIPLILLGFRRLLDRINAREMWEQLNTRSCRTLIRKYFFAIRARSRQAMRMW